MSFEQIWLKTSAIFCYTVWWRNKKNLIVTGWILRIGNRLRDINGKQKCASDYSVREYSRVEVTATAERAPAFMSECTIKSRISRKAACRKRFGESWNNEGVRAEMRTRRNCDAVQLKWGLDEARSVHFLLGVNWKCSYLSCAMECAREMRKGEGNVAVCQAIIRTAWQKEMGSYFTICFRRHNKSVIKTYSVV